MSNLVCVCLKKKFFKLLSDMKVVIFLLTTLLSSSIFAQTALHPGKTGAGYSYLHSLSAKYSADAHNFYFSTGKIDLGLFITHVEISTGKLTTNIDNFGLSFRYTAVPEEMKLMPSVNFSLGSEDDLFFSFGPGLAYIIYDEGVARIYPELYGFFSLKSIEGESHGELSIVTDIVAAFRLGDVGYFKFIPGYSSNKSAHYFSLAGGLSFLL